MLHCGVAMVRAAVADQPAFVVDDREVRRAGASYTVDTLTELRREFPQRSLCLLLRHGRVSRLAELAPLARAVSTSRMWSLRIGPAGRRRRTDRSASSWWIGARVR